MKMIAFIIGVFVGGIFGVFSMALIKGGSRYDKEGWLNFKNQNRIISTKKHSSNWNCAYEKLLINYMTNFKNIGVKLN